jgi:hypothetical protein
MSEFCICCGKPGQYSIQLALGPKPKDLSRFPDTICRTNMHEIPNFHRLSKKFIFASDV